MIASREFVIKKLTELATNPKKKFSQNFLTDSETVKKAVDSLKLNDNDLVIEVGPGLGALTEEVLNRGNKIIAAEIDEDMVFHLRNQFKRNSNFEVIEGDFLKLKLDIEKDKNLKFISNIPYNITSKVIEKIMVDYENVKVFTFMIQKEVTERLFAKVNTKEYSPLSIMLNYLGKLSVVTKVNKDKFIPTPNVDSVILSLEFKEERNKELEVKLYKLLNACFKMRRKTIYNNLISYLPSKEVADEALKKANISPSARAESLLVEDYLRLVDVI